MGIEIDVLNADAAWKLAAPLYEAVWPPQVLAALPWGDVLFAHADLRVLLSNEADEVVCHVGIYRRAVTWNGRKLHAGGIGGVMTREDVRRHGYASIALNAAIRTLRDERSVDFGLLRAAKCAVLSRPRLEAVRRRGSCRAAGQGTHPLRPPHTARL